MLPDLPRLLLLIVGALTLLLGLALWVLDLNKRANRAFGALLVLKGSSLALYQVPFVWPRGAAFAFATLPYLLMPLVPLAVYFASVYPRRRGPLGRPGGGWWTLGTVTALGGFYFWRHDLFWTVGPGPAPHPALSAVAGQVTFTSFGPLSLLLWAAFPVFSTLALLFVIDYSRAAVGPQRMSHFLVGTGFLVNAVFDGARQLTSIRSMLGDPGYPMLPWGWAAALLPVLSLLPAIAAVVYMAAHRFERREQERALERRAFVLVAVAVVAGALPLILPGQGLFFRNPVLLVALAFLRLALPAAVTYGLVRYALFDVDIHVRRGLGYSLLVGLIASAYFLVSEVLEGRVEGRFGELSGLGAAAILTLFSVPLSRVTQRLARVMIPASEADADAARLYAAQFAMLNEDGHLTSKERRCLDQLREQLGLSLQQARGLEMG